MNKIAEYFNNEADSFDERLFVKSRNSNDEISLIKKYLPPFESCSILDIGCGTGRLSSLLKKNGYNIQAIDISPKMIVEAKNKYPQFSQIFENEDFYNLKNRSFDYAISIMGGAFGIIENKNDSTSVILDFLKNLHNMLNDNGKALIEFLNLSPILKEITVENIEAGDFLLDESLVRFSEYFYEKAFMPVELKYILKNSGFNLKKIFTFNSLDSKVADLTIESHVGFVLIEKA